MLFGVLLIIIIVVSVGMIEYIHDGTRCCRSLSCKNLTAIDSGSTYRRFAAFGITPPHVIRASTVNCAS